jgi:hypothetical protein
MEEEDLAGVPVLVFANKQDLLGAMTGAEIMEALELTSLKDRWVHVEVRRASLHAHPMAQASRAAARSRVQSSHRVGRRAPMMRASVSHIHPMLCAAGLLRQDRRRPRVGHVEAHGSKERRVEAGGAHGLMWLVWLVW